MNYGELVAAIQNYTQNSDSVFTGQINNFIVSSEVRVYRSVQLPAFWWETPAADLGNGNQAIGTGAIEVDAVRVSETVEDVDGPWRYLLQKDFDFLKEAYPGGADILGGDRGVPKYWAVEYQDLVAADAGVAGVGETVQINFVPRPLDGASNDIKFIAECYGFGGNSGILSITDSALGGGSIGTSETWLSVTFPDVLLHGALVEAYTFMRSDPSSVQVHEKLFKEGLATMAATATGNDVEVSAVTG